MAAICQCERVWCISGLFVFKATQPGPWGFRMFFGTAEAEQTVLQIYYIPWQMDQSLVWSSCLVGIVGQVRFLFFLMQLYVVLQWMAPHVHKATQTTRERKSEHCISVLRSGRVDRCWFALHWRKCFSSVLTVLATLHLQAKTLIHVSIRPIE